MADAVINTATSLLLLSFFLLHCLTNASSISDSADNTTISGSAALAARILAGRGPWCLAKPGVTPEALQANIQVACGSGEVDCSPIQKGGACYFPVDIAKHAYFYEFGSENKNCNFNGTGLVVLNDPSYGNCDFSFMKQAGLLEDIYDGI